MGKKIGIITLFGYKNYGNRLQMFATQKVYETLGYNAEVIKVKDLKYKEPFLIRIKIFIKFILQYKSNFNKSNLKRARNTSFKIHAGQHYNESFKYINPLLISDIFHESYSFLSVGSDQIWGWFNYDIAEFIFLQFAPKEKRIALAPSFGSSKIDEEHAEVFSKGLKGFNYLSVREESGATIIKNLTGLNATVLCDPTMCLSKEEWLNFSEEHQCKPAEKYLLTYFLGKVPPKAQDIIDKFSCEFKIIQLNSFESPEYYAINPSEWVSYVKDASLFLTDSFHGVVFAIIFQTPFAVYKRFGGENMQTRITNILEKFNLENRFEILVNHPFLMKMDFSGTEEILNQENSKVYSYLQKSLNL
jgi:hypothetical protein